MLKPDPKAEFTFHSDPSKTVWAGFLKCREVPGKRYARFWVGKRDFPVISHDKYLKFKHDMQESPVLVTNIRPPGPHWWWYKEVFYKTSEALTSQDVKALIEASAAKKARKVAHAYAVLATDQETGTVKKGTFNDRAIKPEVKQSVWQRDGGKCVRCGSQNRLEFDHIIPVSMGGSNTARNIQLLCEACNRSKGGSII